MESKTFTNACIYGIPTIAPLPTWSCYSNAPRCSASFGLIKGLRGQVPFDGSRFPPLPWGGRRVSEADIQFIAEWIDGGCPSAPACQSRLSD
jgi:tyrosinase